ncbi:GNAT family N-acetyltransferase [Lewinellaceae bacterium SD302]|nr:GNAT family N-acetyltransferase [Lewinellaceae bacterium SD302]
MLPDLIHTPRLSLRPPKTGDAEIALKRWAGDPEVAKYTSWMPHTEAATIQVFLDGLAKERKEGSCYAYMICRRGETEPIGMIEANPEQGFKAMLGYVLMRSEWGKGYMTEALTKITDLLFEVPTMRRVFAFCDVENPASAAVMRKAGMTDEGILRKYFIHPNLGQEPRDVLMLAKIR